MTSPTKPWAVIAGVGPGTGAAVARKFALEYPVALLARTAAHLDPIVKEINDAGGQAIGISTDLTDGASIKAAFAKIEAAFGSGGSGAAAAVFNASARFVRKGLLETSVEEFTAHYEVGGKGAFLFSQAVLPHLLKTAAAAAAAATEGGNDKSAGTTGTHHHPPTLIFTGATASVKSNAQVAAFATGKFTLRALAFSIAREFAPRGIHVAHAIIDGPIDIPGSELGHLKGLPTDAKISAEGIADSYWYLHTQPTRTFTNEIDIRTSLEKW